MKKKIVTKPVEVLELEFEDGVTKKLKFTNYTVATIDEEFEEGSMNIIFNSIKKPYVNGSKLIYAGMKTCDESVKYEDVKKIVVDMDITTVLEIIQFAIEGLYGGQETEKKSQKEEVQKQAEQILKQIIG